MPRSAALPLALPLAMLLAMLAAPSSASAYLIDLIDLNADHAGQVGGGACVSAWEPARLRLMLGP